MKHHFLPVFFLRGFSDSFPKRNGKLFELDLQTQTQRGPCRPKDLGYVDDLYEAETSGDEDPQCFEEFLNREIEDKAAPIIFSIFENGALPQGGDRMYLLHFIASLASRVPMMRLITEAAVNHHFRDSLLAQTIDTQTFSTLIARSPIEIPSELMETVRLSVRDTLLQGKMSNNVFLTAVLQATSDLFQFLTTRNLRLCICEPNAPDLVCPDLPVRIIPSPEASHSQDLQERYSDSVVVFRLNKRMAIMIGRDGPEYVRDFSTAEALATNRIAVSSAFEAYRFVYSSSKDFLFMGDGGVVSTPDDLRKRRNM